MKPHTPDNPSAIPASAAAGAVQPQRLVLVPGDEPASTPHEIKLGTGWKMQVQGSTADSVCCSHRLLIFLDLLGWRQQVDTGAYGPAQAFLLTVKPFLAGYLCYNAEHGVGMQVSMISDTLLLSLPLNSPNVFRHTHFMFGVAANYVIAAMTCGFLVRGAITAGPFAHDGQLCYGPALHTAYDLERQAANYPRTLVEPDAQAELRRIAGWLPDRRGVAESLESALASGVKQWTDLAWELYGTPLQTDTDGRVHFNWLWGDSLGILDGLRESFIERYSGTIYPVKIAEKINWFIRHLNREGRERGSSGWIDIEPVQHEQS